MSTTAAPTLPPGPSVADRVPDDAVVLPGHVTEGTGLLGPRFGDPLWDFRPFLPRTQCETRLHFSSIDDPITVRTLKEYLYSRLRRGNTGQARRGPLKLTGIFTAARHARIVVETLQQLGVPRLADVTGQDLHAALTLWRRTSAQVASQRVTATRHLFAHGPFLSADRLRVNPWAGRSSHQVAGLVRDSENSTQRIPEQISGPLLKAAVFYVESASIDLLAARTELAHLHAAADVRIPNWNGGTAARVEAFIAECRAAGRGIPALPATLTSRWPGAPVVDNVVQAPHTRLVALLAGVADSVEVRQQLIHAGHELGYQPGGLRPRVCIWPGTGRPWHPGLGSEELKHETAQLRVACWIVIAYLSGMRDAEVRELAPDCAFTEPGDDGRIRYKIRGRVLKGRKLPGDEAEWVVLDIVHRAISVLRELNDDPTHLFGYWTRLNTYALLKGINARLNLFRDHVNELFSTPSETFIPNQTGPRGDGVGSNAGLHADGVPWRLSTSQFRRTLAWHIAHQPFGIVAGSRQYQHAELTVFEGYAGTSASGFAAEVASEQAVAKLDYVEDLYRDWNDGKHSSGGATKRVDAEFERIRRDLGDLPGTVASPARLRTMLRHLTKTLHPGTLNDCFYQESTAACSSHAQRLGRPLPMLNTCSTCPNARRSTVHLPRLTTARDQALDPLTLGKDLPRLQHVALTEYAEALTRLIDEIPAATEERQPA